MPGLSFGSPYILVALVLLPGIWWLLRVTPPMARRVVFPPLRLLLGLRDSEETPARTPWWLLLFRVVAAALVILALAQPMTGSPLLTGSSVPIAIFIDDGWT
ncbi:MAG: BatA domain-containing protein, partial [Alphaproteobacteria bacterium]|nr:BatA domain-containing protein [Alphaproteobacteria bacterium]